MKTPKIPNIKGNKNLIYSRYSYKPVTKHLYFYLLYLLPFTLASSLRVELSVLLLFSILICKLSTYWSNKSLLFQCYRLDLQNKGKYIYYLDSLCEVIPNTRKHPCRGTATGSPDGPASAGEKFLYKNMLYLIYKDHSIRPFTPKTNFAISQYVDFKNSISHSNSYFLHQSNILNFPNPNFLTLLKEQCLSPMFCFQIFTSVLQIFNDYFYSPIFGIVMAFLSEALMVISRIATMKMFGDFKKRNPVHDDIQLVRVYRGSDYTKKSVEKKYAEGNKSASVPKSAKDIENHQVYKLIFGEKPSDIESLSDSFRSGDIIKITSSCENDKAFGLEIPCDLLLLSGGSCIVNEAMLSGESIPITKNPLDSFSGDSSQEFSLIKHKKNVLFSGTKIEKFLFDEKSTGSPQELLCYVLNTGFDTEQGRLLNTMLQTKDLKYDVEALRFVICMSIVGFFGSLFTLVFSKKTGYPLFLDLVIIFTNSIPIELPIEMGMSVQSAVRTLLSKKIYCLEPFRLIFAGKLDVCCFDKTGTLTSAKIEIKDIIHERLPRKGSSGLLAVCVEDVLSVCHSIVKIDNNLRGDPLDLAIMEFFKIKKLLFKSKIIKNFEFTSEMKRQTVLCSAKPAGARMVAMKGAPEEIEKYLKIVPSHYSDYLKYAADGYRVIALSHRIISSGDEFDSLYEEKFSRGNFCVNRKELEKDMVFDGFLLVGSSLRPYAKQMCRTLVESNHKVIMITGDNLLTAMNIAKQLGFPNPPCDGKPPKRDCFSGVEGDQEIESILNESSEIFQRVSVFARANPKYKEMIINKYKSMEKITMMVGDGTNDVGALKAADVGVAILEESAKKTHPGKKPGNGSLVDSDLGKIVEMDELIKPGDASIAAPFTIKSNTLFSVIEIIQQGRSTAVTTIQMYKIIALNSLVGVFTIGFLDLFKIRFSEKQDFILGIVNSVAFNAISHSKALPQISKERIVESIFTKYVIVSIVFQAVTHSSLFILLIYILRREPEIMNFFTSEKIAENGVAKFSPSKVNTAVFILAMFQTIATFVCNYIGRPFRESISENIGLSFSILAMVGAGIAGIVRVVPELSDYLELIDLDGHTGMIALMSIALLAITYFIEYLSAKFFLIKKKATE